MIRAADTWNTNGDLIADVAELYLKPDDLVVDVTYGKGIFWDKVKPKHFIAHDLNPTKGDGVAWNNLPEEDGSVDVLVFDPPYVSPGGRASSTLHEMNSRYEMQMTAPTPKQQWESIVEGLEEAHRALGRRKLLWFKCMNYISSGRLQRAKAWADIEFDRIGFRVEDEFIHVGSPGPQPKFNLDGTTRRQVHARNNASYLIVARKI
jgi:hypothetical protein